MMVIIEVKSAKTLITIEIYIYLGYLRFMVKKKHNKP